MKKYKVKLVLLKWKQRLGVVYTECAGRSFQVLGDDESPKNAPVLRMYTRSQTHDDCRAGGS